MTLDMAYLEIVQFQKHNLLRTLSRKPNLNNADQIYSAGPFKSISPKNILRIPGSSE